MSLNTDYGNEKEREGILEELFIHEGSHASLDGYHANVSYSYAFQFANFPLIITTTCASKYIHFNLIYRHENGYVPKTTTENLSPLIPETIQLEKT